LRKQGKPASLAEAQFALARTYGFPSWRKLKAHIEQLEREAAPTQPDPENVENVKKKAELSNFDLVMKAIVDRDDRVLADLLAAHPEIVHQTGPHPRWGGRPQPLHVAIESNNLNAFHQLLHAGADVNGVNEQYDGWSPLMLSIHWKNDEMREELIRRGASTDLIAALMLRDDRRVSKLLKDPAVLVGPFPNGATPLHFARTVKLARLLLSHGADIAIKDKYGKTAPEQWANLQPMPASLMRLAKSLSVEPPFDIFKAVEHGKVVEVRKLLAAGIDVNSRFPDRAQHTLLHAAAWNGDLPMTRLLVAKGADLYALDREHQSTPADWARFALSAFVRVPCEKVAEYLEGLMKTKT